MWVKTHPVFSLAMVTLLLTNIVLFVFLVTKDDCKADVVFTEPADRTYNTVEEEVADRKGDHLTRHLSHENPFDQFDRVYYINMDKRVDRKRHVEEQCLKMGIPMDKVQRVSGVKAKFGALGCTSSHIIIIKDAIEKGYKRILVLEDDFTFKPDIRQVYDVMNRFFKCGLMYDVLLLACNTLKYEETPFDFCVRMTNGQTTGGYAVNGHYLQTLLDNFEEGARKLAVQDYEVSQYCIDQYWKLLQPTDRWYYLTPVIGHQLDGWSDIGNVMVEYPDKNELKRRIPAYKRIHLSAKGDNIVVHGRVNCRFSYEAVPNLSTEFEVDERDRVIRVRAPKGRMDRCYRFGKACEVVRTLMLHNRRLRKCNGMVHTFSGVKVNPIVCQGDVGGILMPGLDSDTHPLEQANEKVKRQVESVYPGFLKRRVYTFGDDFPFGGHVYLSRSALEKLSLSRDLFSSFPTFSDELAAHFVTENHQYENLALDIGIQLTEMASRHGLEMRLVQT